MKILVTGSNGFLGKNLIVKLKEEKHEIYEYNRATSPELLENYCSDCDFVYHLAGIQRPEKDSEFIEGNLEFTQKIIDTLINNKNICPIMFSSSIHAEYDTLYGTSKRMAEEVLFLYQNKNKIPVFIYRFSNIFGKWNKPNFNSAVTTFCYNVVNNLPVTVNDPSTELSLLYIEDVVSEMLNLLKSDITKVKRNEFHIVQPVYKATLGEVLYLLGNFKKKLSEDEKIIHRNDFEKKLFDTYISYRLD